MTRIPERQAELDALARKYLSDPKPEPNTNGHAGYHPLEASDEEIIGLCRKAKNAAKFADLYDAGDATAYDGDDSSADLALMSILAFYTQDPAQLERIFSDSALGRRRKWGRADYRQRTINRALSSLTETYTPPRKTHASDEEETTKDRPEAPNPFQRADLAGALERGVEPPEVLVPEVILAGKVHSIFSAGGTGKTFYAAYLARKVLEEGGTVLYFDQENGLRIMAERAECLGITPEMAKNFAHYPFPTMPLDFEVVALFEQLLDDLAPDLVVFDSWVNLLAMCGLDENSSVDIATWTEAYSQKARHRGIAVLILDHTPKEGNTARGSGRKLDYVDVMWELRNPQPFDRETVGRIDLHLRKDREGFLPRLLTYSVGGTEDGFIFKRSLGGFEASDEAGLLKSDHTTLDALKGLGGMGAVDKDWREETLSRGLSRATYYRSRETLLRLGLVEQVMNKFFVNTPAKPKSHEVSKESHETNETTANGDGLTRSHTPRGETHETTHAETVNREEDPVGSAPDYWSHPLDCGCEVCA
ncbi:MAG: AAA family ATPase [Actinomycetota bacterium]|nr:AAA family ATPase [Actinomycetota bacterium]